MQRLLVIGKRNVLEEFDMEESNNNTIKIRKIQN